MKKYIVEFIGTFFLVFTVGMVVNAAVPPVLGALAIGSALMVMVYAGGHVSGAHYNPAVTLGVWIRGKCDKKDVVPYWITQLVAAGVAAGVVFLAYGKCVKVECAVAAACGVKWVPFIIAEFVGTFALVWVVLNTATAKGTAGNSFYGLAIGFTVFVCAVTVGGISGGAFNPAVALGLLAVGKSSWCAFTMQVVVNLLGGLVAALAFKAVNCEGCCCEEKK